MADSKISALPASTTPLAGTEVLPVVQSGATKKVAVSDLTAGRNIATNSVTANATLASWSWPDGSSGVFQAQAFAALSGYAGTTYLSQNYYYNNGEKFIANGWAHRLAMGGGSITFATSTASNTGGAGAALNWNSVGSLDSSGNFTILGATATKASGTTWANPSDERLKANVQDYTKGLQELMQLRFVTGEYNGLGGTPKGTKFISVVAQEAQKVLPDTISTFFAKLNEDDEVETEFLKYDSSETQILVAVSVQQLYKHFEKLKQEFDAYKAAHP